jgi:hypothetical protein
VYASPLGAAQAVVAVKIPTSRSPSDLPWNTAELVQALLDRVAADCG